MEDKFIIITKENLLELVDELIAKSGLKQKVEKSMWVDAKEAMKILSVGKTTLYKLRTEGHISYSEITSKNFLYERASLLYYIHQKAKKSFNHE